MAKLGKKQSPEHIANRVLGCGGKCGNKKGFRHTQETKDKISKNSAKFYLGKKLSREHVENMMKNQIYYSGEKSRRYVKDRSKLKINRRHSYDSLCKEWAKKIKNRDHWKCLMSNPDCSGRLEAHHILSWRDYPELRYDVNNGITLCKFHHPRKFEDEKLLSPYFQELVKQRT